MALDKRKCADAILKATDVWTTFYNKTIEALAKEYFDVTGKKTELSKLRSRKGINSYGDDTIEKFREFFNDKYSCVGTITNSWNFNESEDQTVYYCLYYPRNDAHGSPFGKALIEVTTAHNKWVDFTLTNYPTDNPGQIYHKGEKGFVEESKYLIHVAITHTVKAMNLWHFYTFLKPENPEDRNLLWGTYTRKKKRILAPSAGVCLLLKLDTKEKNEAEKILTQNIPIEIQNLLYNRRIELHRNEYIGHPNEYPNQESIEIFKKLAGTWEGIHLDSDMASQDGEKGFIRTVILNINETGIATIRYHDSEHDVPVSNIGQPVSGFFRYEHSKLLYGEFALDNDHDTNRIIVILEIKPRGDNEILKGCYGGFSELHQKPYAGAITFKRNEAAKIRNIPIRSQMFDEHHKLLDIFIGAYENYINLPTECLSESLLAYYYAKSDNENNTIRGEFTTYSLKNDKTAIIAYPIKFANNVCTLYGMNEDTREVEVYTTHINWIKDKNVIWLDFIDSQKGVYIFQYDPGDFSKQTNFTGISLRINQLGRIQTKREAVLKNTTNSKRQFKAFPLNSKECEELFATHPALKNLMGREYNLMQVPASQSKKLELKLKRRDFVDIFLVFSLKKYLQNKNTDDWKDFLEQAMLHGGILNKDNLFSSLEINLQLFKHYELNILEVYKMEFDEIEKRIFNKL